MTDIRITVDDKAAQMSLERLIKGKGFKRGLLVAGLHLKSKFAHYPAARPHPARATIYGQPFQNAAQRRAFFAKLRSGDIEVPYRRGQSPGSKDLGQRWTVKAVNNGYTVIVGNNASYAPFVMGLQQSAYMKALGWKTVVQLARPEMKTIGALILQEIRKDLKGNG